MATRAKVGDKVIISCGYGTVIERENPTGYRYRYTVKLDYAFDDEIATVGKEYVVHYVKIDRDSNKTIK